MKKFYECNCYSEVLNAELDICILDREKDMYDAQVDLSIWYYGAQDHRYNWKEVLRHCWQVIKNRRPYPDQFCFDVQKAREFANDLLLMTDDKYIKEEYKNEKDRKYGGTNIYSEEDRERKV